MDTDGRIRDWRCRVPSPPLGSLPVLDIYADESCKDNHHFLVLGATIVPTERAGRIRQIIQEERHAERLLREIKWGKSSRCVLPKYKRMVELYFDLLRRGDLCFHALILDAHKFNHRKYNNGCSETGYNKFLYQLLLGVAGKLPDASPYYVYLDSRTVKHSLDDLRRILNCGARRKTGSDNVFRRVQFRDSKVCDIIQLNDLIIGAIGAVANGHGERPDASPVRKELSSYITKLAGVRSLAEDTPYRESRFKIWNFKLRE